MAEIQYTLRNGTGNTIILTWPDMAAGDVGAPAPFGDYSDRTVVMQGTFGGAVVLKGSLDQGVTYHAAKDQAGTAISETSNDSNGILTNFELIRPEAGAGVSSVTVIIHARRGK